MSKREHLDDFIGLYKFYWDLALKRCIFIVGLQAQFRLM